MQLKRGIIYIVSWKQLTMFIEKMSEDSVFIANIEHYIVCSRRKRLPKTYSYCIFHMYVSKRRKKDEIYS